ncbi:MAG: TerB family tellurite resistance protein [Nitratireductor sp.]|nr:TerB family tellurite resistance protein [Nitratireductor sp.]MCB1455075.1 TerB family tellurite resistance protein [Nitratireductor sp.]MCB1460506.1 TerB family tellurite resistance protein [Nitratireductor sp.]
MFSALKKFLFDDHSGAASDTGEGSFRGDEIQIAEAALMFHVIAADGIVTEDERQRLSRSLEAHFGLTRSETDQLIEAARDADTEAIDLFSFTRVLRRGLDQDQRLQLVANLWDMVYADGVVHEIEDNIVWRVAELLDVETRDRMELKHRARAAANSENSE